MPASTVGLLLLLAQCLLPGALAKDGANQMKDLCKR